jgi:hypothetical protein
MLHSMLVWPMATATLVHTSYLECCADSATALRSQGRALQSHVRAAVLYMELSCLYLCICVHYLIDLAGVLLPLASCAALFLCLIIDLV